MTDRWAPTSRLRWVQKSVPAAEQPPPKKGVAPTVVMVECRVLQVWWAEDIPSYMRNSAKGEWRDVPVEGEAP